LTLKELAEAITEANEKYIKSDDRLDKVAKDMVSCIHKNKELPYDLSLLASDLSDELMRAAELAPLHPGYSTYSKAVESIIKRFSEKYPDIDAASLAPLLLLILLTQFRS